MNTVKKALLIFLAALGFATQAGSKTQITPDQIQAPAATGVMADVPGRGWTLAVLDSTITLDTSTAPPTLRANGGPPVNFVDWTKLTGTIDGSNATFTLPSVPNPPASLTLIRNGLVMTNGLDYSLSSATVTFLSGAIPQTGDSLSASYRR